MRSGGTGLTGTFYDLKQSQSHQPTGMTPDEYGQKVVQFVQGGFNVGILANYYKANRPIYATHIFTPNIPAELGPKAFGVEKEVQPTMWLVHYKGSVTVPEAGTFRFVGMGDDLLLVKFNDHMVLDACWYIDTGRVQGQRHFEWDWAAPGKARRKGRPSRSKRVRPTRWKWSSVNNPAGRVRRLCSCNRKGRTIVRMPRGRTFCRTSACRPTRTSRPPSACAGWREGWLRPHTNNGPIWRSASSKDSPSIFSH